jgi:hypothetical protein
MPQLCAKRKKTFKRKYTVRTLIARLTVGSISFIHISMLIATLIGLDLLLKNHVKQVILLPSVKNFETMASILAIEDQDQLLTVNRSLSLAAEEIALLADGYQQLVNNPALTLPKPVNFYDINQTYFYKDKYASNWWFSSEKDNVYDPRDLSAAAIRDSNICALSTPFLNANFVARTMYKGGDAVKVYAGFDESGIVCNGNLNLATTTTIRGSTQKKIDSTYNCASPDHEPPKQPAILELFDTNWFSALKIDSSSSYVNVY